MTINYKFIINKIKIIIYFVIAIISFFYIYRTVINYKVKLKNDCINNMSQILNATNIYIRWPSLPPTPITVETLYKCNLLSTNIRCPLFGIYEISPCENEGKVIYCNKHVKLIEPAWYSDPKSYYLDKDRGLHIIYTPPVRFVDIENCENNKK